MVELTATDPTADPCCAPKQQATCCEPSAKADCCGHDESCGCDADLADIEMRETHRVYPQAASAIIHARKPIEHRA